MSKRYEDLTDSEKLVNSPHFPGKIGPTFRRMLEGIQHQLDNLVFAAADVVNDSFQVNNSWSGDLEKVGAMLDVVRIVGETDEEYRNRIITEATTFETVTVDSILDLYEALVGSRPTLTEPFVTKVYQSGDESEGDDGGTFTLLFSVEMTKRSERLKIASGGTSVIVTDDTIVSPSTESLSTNINTTTDSIEVGATTNFADWGELMIEDEWVSYGSKDTNTFLGCVRGLYDSVPATHATAVTVVEGCTKAFLYQTPTQVYSSQSGTIIYLKDGPYDWDTYLEVQYKITNQYKEEFDTPQELGAALEQLQVIGYDFKAAGINANIIVGYTFRSWFSVFRENITISDWHKIIATHIAFPERLDFGEPPETQVFSESEWDVSDWDTGLWAQAYWNGSTWVYFGEKRWEYVIIRGT